MRALTRVVRELSHVLYSDLLFKVRERARHTAHTRHIWIDR